MTRTIAGDAANDLIVLQEAMRETVMAGDGDDNIIVAGQWDQIDGEDGHDKVGFRPNSNPSFFVRIDLTNPALNAGMAKGATFTSIESFILTSQNDTFTAATAAVLVHGSGGNDVLTGGDGEDQFYTSDGNDTINGGKGADRVFAGAGNDIVTGGDGADRLTADEGNDLINGGTGTDWIFAGNGNDTVEAGDDADEIQDNDGNDVIRAGNGDDLIFNGAGADLFDGGAGRDRFFAGSGLTGSVINLLDQSLNAGVSAGDRLLNIEVFGLTRLEDRFQGTTAAQRVEGRHGNDIILGGGGGDTLLGEDGDDVIAVTDLSFELVDGGIGNDILQFLAGGLVFNLADFRNKIYDIDTIDIRGTGANTLNITPASVIAAVTRQRDGEFTLRIQRNGDDIVNLLSSWTSGGSTVIEGCAISKAIVG